MLRIKTVSRVTKDWPCTYCADPIPKGSPALTMTAFRRPTVRRHVTCPMWRNSERESNEGKSQCWQAVEGLEDALQHYKDHGPSPDELAALQTAWQDAANQMREAAEVHREAANNLRDGGFQTSQVDDIEELADQYEQWADDWENQAEDIDPNVADEEEEELFLEAIENAIGEVDAG